MVLCGNDVGIRGEATGKRIQHVHVKDAVGKPGTQNENFMFPMLGEGVTDWKDFFDALNEVGYNGYLSVEFEAENYLRNVWQGDWAKALKRPRCSSTGSRISSEAHCPSYLLGEDGFVRFVQGPMIRRDEVLSFAKKEGFQGIELHAQFEMYTPGVAKATKQYYANYGQEIPGIQTGHIGFFYPPISEDDATRANYVSAVGDALKFAEELDAHHSTLTPPLFTTEMTPEYDILLDRYIKVVEQVVEKAEKRNVVMAIEPEPNLIMNGGGLRECLEDVNLVLNTIKSKNLAILYDISHVNIISHGDPVGFLKALKGRVSSGTRRRQRFFIEPIWYWKAPDFW